MRNYSFVSAIALVCVGFSAALCVAIAGGAKTLPNFAPGFVVPEPEPAPQSPENEKGSESVSKLAPRPSPAAVSPPGERAGKVPVRAANSNGVQKAEQEPSVGTSRVDASNSVPVPPKKVVVAPELAIAPAKDVPTIKKSVPAKQLFGYERRAADMKPQAIGFYSKGCLAGGKMLPPTGKYWQAMRLSRNRNWAHPQLVDLVMRLAEDANKKDGWRGLMVGDLTQPRGGPMLSGHASHQVGLDADIWLREMPARVIPRKERETFQPISMLKNYLDVDPKKMTKRHVALIRRAALDPIVERVGVNPAIKVALCRAAGGDKPWLAKIQGWAGHHYHMHIRIRCPEGSTGCTHQGRPQGASCRAAEKWYRDTKAWMERPKKKKKKVVKKKPESKPTPPITLDNLPSACRNVLTAQARDVIEDLIVPPTPKPPPSPPSPVAVKR